VWQDGDLVGEDVTDLNGNYIIGGIETECFSNWPPPTGCEDYRVTVVGAPGATQARVWDGCGDIETVNFPF
jgi:hypothetical protein